MVYTVYKVTNLVNGKTYVGVHKTKNPYDSYMGSGVAIKQAIGKYGKEMFSKIILLITEDKTEAFELEKNLTVDFNENSNYNMKLGGVGGFTKETARLGYEKSIKNFDKDQLKENGQKSYINGLSRLSKEELQTNGRLGGLALKGIPKTEAHKKALRESWLKRNRRVA